MDIFLLLFSVSSSSTYFSPPFQFLGNHNKLRFLVKKVQTCSHVSQGVNAEYIVTHHGQFKPALNIMNNYGAQESKQTIEDIKSDWEEIVDEITKIKAKRESTLVIGDINRHIGNELVKDNHGKVTPAGKLLLEFIDNIDFIQ